ncbi:MAG: DUF2079 domain-containing protein [Thermoplasmata archaeon]
MANQEAEVKGILSRFQKKYLAAIVAIVIAVMASISYIRYLNFYTSNWDLGIEMQMLKDNFHGYILYEAGDFETYGVVSHLEIHSTYIALLFSYAYQALGEPIFLFVCQALFFSLSLIPLNALSRYYGLSDKQSLIISILYVTNVGFIASQMYDFHWMSLIPVELLTFFYLIARKRYALSAILMVIGTLTLEVFPILDMGVLLFFYYEEVLSAGNLRKYIVTRGSLQIVFLAIFSVAIFLVIKDVNYDLLPPLLHNNLAISILKNNYPESFFPSPFSFFTTGSALLYWGILYSSLGLIPFLYRRHLIIALPWLYESILVVPQYASIQDQYSFIALPPLFIGLILAIRRGNQDPKTFTYILKTAFYALLTCLSAVIAYDAGFAYPLPHRIILSVIVGFIVLLAIILMRASSSILRLFREHRKSIYSALTVVFILILVFNFLIGPLNISNEEKTVDSGYAFSYSMNPEYNDMIKMVSMIPGNASIISSDNLFPYISKDPNAFSFYWSTPENLTFFMYYNLSANFSFTYVLIDQSQLSYIPQQVLSHIQTSYGLLSAIYAQQSYPGNIYLYKFGFTGKAVNMFQ